MRTPMTEREAAYLVAGMLLAVALFVVVATIAWAGWA